MSLPERVQAARKKVQTKRLDAKTKKGYIDHCGKDGLVDKLGFFASQPLQLLKAAQNEKIRLARMDYVATQEDLEVAEITGDGLQEAQQKFVVAGLALRSVEAAKLQRTGISLTNAGGK